MTRLSRWTSSAAIGGVLCLAGAVGAGAQTAARAEVVGRVVSLAPGSIQGLVQDEQGAPVSGAIVSAFGVTSAFAVTDRSGRFELRTLSPGPYLVRAHLSGFVASRGQMVDVRPSARVSSSIALRHAASSSSVAQPVLTAGIGVPAGSTDSAPAPPAIEAPTSAPATADDHGETAWRLRHARRSILKESTIQEALAAADTPDADAGPFGPANILGRAMESPARFASSLLSGMPFSGQLNLLTTGSFDSPLQLLTTDSFSRGVAYMSVGAPAGDHGDWQVQGALTQGDFTSWIVAGSYTTRAPARHRYDVGLSYATERYDGSNPAALRDVTDGGRNVGTLYGYDSFAIAPAVTFTYGGRYDRYAYLESGDLVSPRVALTVTPADRLRVNALASSRALAPGAEEFVPPADRSIWLPPQRTFSSLKGPLEPERTEHVELGVERDIAASTVSFRAFRQHVDDQLVTLFGVDMPRGAGEELAHYFVSNSGAVDATGWSAGFRAAIADRVHGSIEYTLAQARWNPAASLDYLLVIAPSTVRLASERIHDLSTVVETEVPETATRVIVACRVSNGFAHRDAAGERPALDSRFDVQVRQSLRFMDFSTARWEMLVAVRNFFRDAAPDQSLFDELLVVRPPKRIIGGLTLRF